jgi:hypothetical protein
MGEIYRGAALNIAAGGAVNSHSQLFSSRDASRVQPCRVELNWTEMSVGLGRGRSDIRGSYVVVSNAFLEDSLLQIPLNRRGWVMQERTLSVRLLHFGKDQLFWRCMNHNACETFPNGIPNAFDKTYGIDLEKFEYGKDSGSVDSWFYIVETYSMCQLTYESDRLVALSGLAKMYDMKARGANNAYLAGLWQSKLASFLLWRLLDGKQSDGTSSKRCPAHGLPNYVAPSWSWASVLGKVAFRYSKNSIVNKFSQLFDLIEARIAPVDMGNPYGQVLEGSISIRATLVPGRKFHWSRSRIHEHDQQSDRNYNTFVASTKPLGRNAMICVMDDRSSLKPRTMSPLSIIGVFKAPDIDFCPLVARQDKGSHALQVADNIPDIEGILVTRIDGKDNVYQRVGYFCSSLHSKDVSFFLDQKRSDIVLV